MSQRPPNCLTKYFVLITEQGVPNCFLDLYAHIPTQIRTQSLTHSSGFEADVRNIASQRAKLRYEAAPKADELFL